MNLQHCYIALAFVTPTDRANGQIPSRACTAKRKSCAPVAVVLVLCLMSGIRRINDYFSIISNYRLVITDSEERFRSAKPIHICGLLLICMDYYFRLTQLLPVLCGRILRAEPVRSGASRSAH